MKLTSRLAKLRRDSDRKRRDKTHGPHEGGLFALSTWILLALCLALAGVGTLAIFEFLVWNKVPPELVGFWEVDEGPQKGASFEFFGKGAMEIHMKNNK